MTRESALGLFGELWFLRRWLGSVNAMTMERWQATESARHDFQWKSASVEVKTAETQIPGAPVHRIASLEQLADPEQGGLYLFSLQVHADALAANTLHTLVASIAADLDADRQALSHFNDKLAVRGYTPADQQMPARTLRILGESLYQVRTDFPRITRATFLPSGVPSGVAGLEYRIDLAGCDDWIVAKHPREAHSLLRDEMPDK